MTHILRIAAAHLPHGGGGGPVSYCRAEVASRSRPFTLAGTTGRDPDVPANPQRDVSW